MQSLDTATYELLAAAHQQYETTVSTPGMPISLELGVYLWSLAEERKPRRVLDLGSGFSSFVFRLWARETGDGATIWSVDHDAAWLIRTRGFLESHDLPTENMTTWDDFEERDFDLVLDDLGNTDFRTATFEKALALIGPGGVLVLDDAQFGDHAERAAAIMDRLGFQHHSLHSETLDRHGRFSWLVTQQPVPGSGGEAGNLD